LETRLTISTNPFIGKTSTSPRKGSDADAIASLREGMPKMDIASMANNGDYSFSREKENGKDGAKGRDVSLKFLLADNADD
jgi:hypothetical protein